MSDAVEVVERLLGELGKGNLDVYDEILSDDFVQDWPQSGERVEGAANVKAIMRNFPNPPSETKMRRLFGSGQIAVAQIDYVQDGKPGHAICVYEVEGNQIVRETDYFADPFPAPAWRSEWVRTG